MDREALEHSLVRRLLDHIEHGTTDLTDHVVEVAADTYTSRERYDDEVEVLFHGRPLVLCLSGSLPRAGSYLTVDLCGTPVLVTRDASGKVQAMANVCRHRGVRVVDGAGDGRRFTCPFHAWTYDLEGKLVGLPTADAFDGMCREDKGLVQLPVVEGYGLVVGCLRPGPAIDIDQYLGPDLAGELAMLDFADWEPFGETHVHPVAANWKVTLDTFRENYHFNHLHRDTLAGYAYGGVLTFDAFGPHLRNSSAIRSIDELRDRPEQEWGDVSEHFSYQYQLFPNTSLTFDRRHVELWQILPVAVDRSEVLHTVYLRPGLSDADRSRAVDMAPWICETVVDGEDFWVAGRTEPGIRTGLLDTVVFGRNEPAPQHLHQGFAAALAAARGTEPRRSGKFPASSNRGSGDVLFGTTVMAGPRRWADVARAAEAAGFESVWVPEHLIMPVKMTGAPNTPHEGEPPISAATPAFDPWVQIATMAAQTSTLRFGTNVYNIGLRHPFVTARALTTVDVVSGGRVEFGIGASWLSQEWEAVELPFETRGRRVDESIRIVQRLFSEEVVEHEGEFFHFQPVGFLPKPVQQPWPPMLIGGDSPTAMRRAARLGDGWLPMQQSLDTLPGNLKQIHDLRAEAGRSGPFAVTMHGRVESLDDVRRYEDAGVTRLLVTPFTNPREAAEGFQRFGDDIIANL